MKIDAQEVATAHDAVTDNDEDEGAVGLLDLLT